MFTIQIYDGEKLIRTWKGVRYLLYNDNKGDCIGYTVLNKPYIHILHPNDLWYVPATDKGIIYRIKHTRIVILKRKRKIYDYNRETDVEFWDMGYWNKLIRKYIKKSENNENDR